jgi:polygalacturonase
MKKTAFTCAIALATCALRAQYWTTPAPVTLPTYGSGNFLITSYGASTSSSDNTTAIQNAINAAGSASGGGTVEVPSGTFLCGPLTMKNNVRLNLDSGATLKLLPYGTYPNPSSPADFIYAANLHDVQISGSGTIDGQGQAWWTADINTSGGIPRPKAMIAASTSTNVCVSGIKLINPPNTHISFRNICQNVTVKNVTISCPGNNAPNTDGIDISADHVYLASDNISCGDDCVAMIGKYIDIESCTFGTGHGCSMGSYTTEGGSFITVNNCTFSGTSNGMRLKSARGRGGVVQYVAYNNLTMTSVQHPVWIDSYYTTSDATDPRTVASATVTSTTPIWKHMKLQNWTVTGSTDDGTLYGLPEAHISDITFSNVKLSATTGLRLYYADSIVFTNGSKVSVSSGNPVTIWAATVSGISTHTYP